jgi:UDP-glucose 4-epimerase
MKILFTGASSLTGLWFVKELADCGHEVTACFRHKEEAYTEMRKKRVDQALQYCKPVFECPFGSDAFIKAINTEPEWNLFCHHAADVTNYKDPDFNVVAATANNTHNLKATLKALADKGCLKIVLTGSVFEQQEGAGSDNLRAVSPYGLSKGLTSAIFQYYAAIMGLKLGKFVISNPFGPCEEVRYTSYLIQTWFQNKTALLSAPDYVRDNIHVSLLAKAYRSFCHRLSPSLGFEKFNPSGYVETQKAFTERFSKEMRDRLRLECRFECKPQLEFSEPKVRINLDVLNHRQLEWDEVQAWNELAAYYENTYGKNVET